MADGLQHNAATSIVGADDSDGVRGRTVWASVAYGALRPDRKRNNPEATGIAILESVVSKDGGHLRRCLP